MSKWTDSIEEDARTLANRIRGYCRSQKDLWQQVPALALKADGRSGFADNLECAYRYRLWKVYQLGGWIGLNIDLRCGELIIFGDVNKSASDREVLCLVWELEKLNASKIIVDLKKQASKRQDHSIHIVKMNPRWREDLAKALKLSL